MGKEIIKNCTLSGKRNWSRIVRVLFFGKLSAWFHRSLS